MTDMTIHKFKIGDRVFGGDGAHRTPGKIAGYDGHGYCGVHDDSDQECPGPFYSVDVGNDFGESCYAEHELTASEES